MIDRNVNRHYMFDDRSEKDRYLDFWGYEAGTEEGEHAWKEKCLFTCDKERAPLVMPDIDPYISMIDGRVINSRSSHREHLKDNNCIEIGNETKYLKPKPITEPPGLKDEVIKQFKLKQEELRYKR